MFGQNSSSSSTTCSASDNLEIKSAAKNKLQKKKVVKRNREETEIPIDTEAVNDTQNSVL